MGRTPWYPLFSQKIAISQGVYEGGYAVNAVRYPSEEYMTSWYLTTDLYDGNVQSLMVVHYYHVAFNRPDLLKYLALPFGFRFYVSATEIEVWYDDNVANI
ncbi:hypothetical protein GC096_32740 [Paenibacillus sp. LMG 31461]|uniref:Imm33-like domain-containing protein n=1 Tax=Paenibacillus plantarum TaxID=2654975 RepID=A0ABX1XK31_9BACL|nr:hypothetical protein [Paenibacillus plantarum]NOU68792.1 hypothetical protein [Paenibacillus plantarum]